MLIASKMSSCLKLEAYLGDGRGCHRLFLDAFKDSRQIGLPPLPEHQPPRRRHGQVPL